MAIWYDIAKKEIGVKEVDGAGFNRRIIEYYRAANVVTSSILGDDAVAWCSAFLCWVIEHAGFLSPNTLVAMDWLKWGRKLDKPALHCIVVLKRGVESWQAHVGIVTDWTADQIKVLAGNQDNEVNEQWFRRDRVLGYRWPLVLETMQAVKHVIKARATTIAIEGEHLLPADTVLPKPPWYASKTLRVVFEAIMLIGVGILQIIPVTSTIGKGLAKVLTLSGTAGPKTLKELITKIINIIITYLKQLKKE